MSYIVLARKWRPMNFVDVIGQEHATRTLLNALAQDKLGHAFIFSGPRGVGKTTTARLLAKAVNCLDNTDVNPCNVCETCNAITSGKFLDVIEIDGASNRGIDEIRNLRENIRFAPAVGKFKIYIIDEIHMLSKEAFNALLKTLEEPPAHAKFIFATTEIHKLPATILSRCQRYDFKRIPTQVISAHLKKIADNEKINIEEEALTLIARKADGGMRDATSILDQLSAFAKDQITVSMVQETLGILGEDIYFEYVELVQKKDDKGILTFVNQLFENGHDFMHFMEGLQLHFRNLMLTKMTGSAQQLDTSDYYKKSYSEQSQLFDEKDLLHHLELLIDGESRLKQSENKRLSLELILLKLAHKPLSIDVQELLKWVKKNGNKLENSNDSSDTTPKSAKILTKTVIPQPQSANGNTVTKPSPFDRKSSNSQAKKPSQDGKPKNNLIAPPPLLAPPKPTKTAESKVAEESVAAEIDISIVKEKWGTVLDNVRKDKIALASFLQEGVPHNVNGNNLEIAFDIKKSFHQMHVTKNALVIEKCLKQILNTSLKISCVKIDFSKKGIVKSVQSPEEVFENMKNKEPILSKIIDLFDLENLD